MGSYSISDSVLSGADIHFVELAVGDDSTDHEIDLMERFRLAMKIRKISPASTT